ncbi:MAG: DNA repair protein RadC [Acidobacteriota bacterium]
MEGSSASSRRAEVGAADRLNTEGTEVLGDVELLAVVIGGAGGLELASRLVAETGSLPELARIEGGALPPLAGLTRARAARVQAALELGKRSTRPREARKRIEGPEDFAALLRPRLQHAQRELFAVAALDARNAVLGWRVVSEGTLNQSLVGPREVFRFAVIKGAARLCIGHGHPSGDSSPSPEDIALTRRLVEIGKLMGIEVVDHVIVGDGTFHSMRGDSRIGW